MSRKQPRSHIDAPAAETSTGSRSNGEQPRPSAPTSSPERSQSTAPQQSDSSASVQTAATNGATETPLTAEELQSLALLRRHLGLDKMENALNQVIDRLNGQGGPVSSSGLAPIANGNNGSYSPPPGPKTWKDAIVSLGDVIGKVIEKIPPEVWKSGSSSPMEAEYAARYKNLMDVAYGRYIPPGTLTPPVTPPP